MRSYILFLLSLFSLCFAEETGFSYWWQSDGLINYQQMEELNDLSGDSELWCALAELYVGTELAEEADCLFAQEAPKAPKAKKGKKAWNANLKTGSNLDSNGHFINKFAKISGKAWKFSGEASVREGRGARGAAAFRHGIFHAKGGDLTNKHRGVLSELNLSDLKLGGEWLFRQGQSDSSWLYGSYSKNLFKKSLYSGGNFRLAAPYNGGTRLWSRSWQGVRYGNWNLRITEIAVLKETENTLEASLLAERKRQGARLAFEQNKNQSKLSAGFKPILKGTDSLWARAEHPISTRIGWDKKLENLKISNSFNLKKNWTAEKPLEYRSESKMKIPLAFSPALTFRWTAHVYRDGRLNLRQFYVEGAVGF